VHRVRVALDPDNDGIITRWEFCHFNTDPDSNDTDGDGCTDGKEVALTNGDFAVNSGDQLTLATAFLTTPGPHVPRRL
jgi:hypothetical protein